MPRGVGAVGPRAPGRLGRQATGEVLRGSPGFRPGPYSQEAEMLVHEAARGGLDLGTPFAFACNPWTVDASVFAPPASVSFSN